jgi:hypothetical protein
MAPHNFWKDEGYQLQYVSWMQDHLGISRPQDWYGVTQYQWRKKPSHKGKNSINLCHLIYITSSFDSFAKYGQDIAS